MTSHSCENLNGVATISARPATAVVIPMANESVTVVRLLDEILVHLGTDDAVICVFDDACKDDTMMKAKEYAESRDSRVVVVWSPENTCVVDAYFRGYREAYDRGYDWILEMDAGFSHRPCTIPQFMKSMNEGYDFVGGSRFMKGGACQSPASRIIFSWGGTLLARFLLGAKMSDMTSGFECFNRAALAAVLEDGVRSRANFFQAEIRWKMHQWRWKEIPIEYSNDKMAVGRSSIREALKLLWRMRQEHRRNGDRA